jgi:hypothetical protein
MNLDPVGQKEVERALFPVVTDTAIILVVVGARPGSILMMRKLCGARPCGRSVQTSPTRSSPAYFHMLPPDECMGAVRANGDRRSAVLSGQLMGDG